MTKRKMKQENDYEVMFIKMYRDFANTNRAFQQTKEAEDSEINNLSCEFFDDMDVLYKEHLHVLMDKISEKFGKEETKRIKENNTHELQYKKVKQLLNISDEKLCEIFNFEKEQLDNWFNLQSANPIRQSKIYDLCSFLELLNEMQKDLNLVELLSFSYIQNDLVIDEDEEKFKIIPYVLGRWHDKTDYEIAREVIDNYKEDSTETIDGRLREIE